MEKLIFKPITNDIDTALFLDKVENYSGVRLPMQYARNSKIVGAFLHEKLVAGYMLVTQPEFRSLMFVPDESKRDLNFFDKDPYEMMEVNGLWIGPSLKTPGLQVKVWMNLIKELFLCRKKYVLLMRDVRNTSMERFLNMANPETLFAGAPLVMAGERTHSEIHVSFTTRWKIVLNAHKYFLELRSRRQRAKISARQRALA